MRREPAFPYTTYNLAGQEVNVPGMDLRDWFAGMALQGMISNPAFATRFSDHDDLVSDAYDLVSDAYDFADIAIRMRRVES
jgi:hypothetical protein